MKIKFLLFVLAGGFVLASCSDKEAEQKIADLEKQMHVGDSACAAEKTALMDSIAALHMEMEEWMKMDAMKSSTSSKSSTSTKSTTTVTPAPDKKVDVNVKGGDTKKTIDIKKKGGATGGN
ncbi:MAG TPA: hypothetical protein PK511_01415 [Chitinophagales bacterium]|nr:hypothetical protein [Chitinophagales bacterium]HMU70410.1 hypothetical protein [Chitinophagales bacterium]HMX03022.1 hypothetical protein [Chitinophagales bacterium]HMZ88010.1 hypothetical protein [Chitinophagales bacterium]HNA57785.1 hypothetical protein [Chitinophagales bacterium]